MLVAEEQLFESVGLSPIATVISNPRRPDNPLVGSRNPLSAGAGMTYSFTIRR